MVRHPPPPNPITNTKKEHLNNEDLTSFTPDDLTLVRVATSAYGIHLFGKIRIPKLPDSYLHVRLFIGSGEPAKLHCIHTEEKDDGNGGKAYRGVFKNEDELEWFDT